jgi:hypothetical protein
MWTCPQCKHKFYNRNQAHSCGHYTVEGFMSGKSEIAQKLFEAFLGSYSKIGEFDLHPVKTRVALLTKMRFASINKLGKDFLNGHLVLTELYPDDEIFYKIDNLANRFYIHHFRLEKIKDINKQMRIYMKLAYAVGQRKHIGKVQEHVLKITDQ